ncbi:MAG: OPT family oligopeptide transporter [Candidatus Melainabacteria bacterium]|nr:OPT family oligopeptide transporter [Candidatus Melainabacteria bacterium]
MENPQVNEDTKATDIAAFENEEDPDRRHKIWLEKIYQGDQVPQLTVRAVIMGGLLGMLMSISNLYTTLKLGWAFGVALTACVLSYCIWNSIRVLAPKLTPMSILENACMQSTASAAGYSTGSTIGMAFGAYLLITGKHVDAWIVFLWTVATACLGVFIAVPLKRQLINREFLAFPDGIACATTLRSLYSQSKEAVQKAYSLVATMALGALMGFLTKGDFAWQTALKLKIPEMIPFGNVVINGASLAKMPGFGFEPGLLMIGAGMIIGMRVCTSMFLASILLYFVIAPQIVSMNETLSEGTILRWAVWTGTSILVTNGLAAFALQWKTIARALQSASSVKEQAQSTDTIEVPMKWLVIGLIPSSIMMVVLELIAFNISIPLGILSVIMSFVLALVACRATGETNITPIGAMGKITQLAYAFLAPTNMTTNLMAASVTANSAVASADLLTDLKSGYLLGANPRKQFWAQFIGVFFGSIAIVPAWFAMVPNKEVLESYNPPSTVMWKAMAEALSVITQSADKLSKVIPPTAQEGILIGAAIGIGLAIADTLAPKRVKKFLPSAMGLGLSWVMPLINSLGFMIGAVLGLIWSKLRPQNAEVYLIPVASGAIAGESLMCAIIAIIKAGQAISGGI